MIFEAKNNMFTSKNVLRSKKNKKWLTGGPKMTISKQKIKKIAKSTLTIAKKKKIDKETLANPMGGTPPMR